MTARILEHHGFMNHGELQVRCRVVDRNASVLRDRNHNQREQRKCERDAKTHRRRHGEACNRRDLRRSCEQREREDDCKHHRLGD